MSLDKGPAIFPLSADTIPTLAEGEKNGCETSGKRMRPLIRSNPTINLV